MKKIILITIILFNSTLFSQTQTPYVQKFFGGSGNSVARAVQTTSDGGFIVAGNNDSSGGDVTVNHGERDYWVVKIDASGNIQWEKSLGGSGDDTATAIQTTSDGGYLVAGHTISLNGDVSGPNLGGYDVWLVKLDALGNIQWQKSIGSSGDDEVFAMQATSDDGYVLACRQGSIGGNYWNWDCYIIKIDASGNIQWQKTMGGSGQDVAHSIQVTPDGGYIVSGVSNSNDGDVTVNNGGVDCWVIKLDTIGNLQWQKSYGGSGNDAGYSIQVTSDGGYIVAGTSNSNNGDLTGNYGNRDFWVLKLDVLGNIQWQKNMGGSGNESAVSVQVTYDGGYLVGGFTSSNNGDVTGNHGSYDCWVLKLDVSGNIQWQKTLGGSGSDWASAIQTTTDDAYVVVGYSDSNDATYNKTSSSLALVSSNTKCTLVKQDLISSSIITQPNDVILCNSISSSVNISVVCNATSPIYQWQYRVPTATNSNPSWVTITSANIAIYSGYNTSTLSIVRSSITLPAVGTEYRVRINDGTYCLVSNIAKLNNGATNAGKIITLPTNPAVCEGSSVTFTLVGSVGTSTQWQSSSTPLSTSTPPANWIDINGATNSSYTTDPLTPASKKYYRAVLNNSYCGTTSITATKSIIVSPTAVPGIIKGGGIVCNYGTGTQKFTIQASGYVGSLQWQYSNASTPWTNVTAGSTSNPFTSTSFSSSSTGKASSYIIQNITGDTNFRAFITSGACVQIAITNSVSYILGSAQGGTLISNISGNLCPGTGTLLTLSGSVGTIKWLKSINFGTLGTSATWTTAIGTSASLNTGNLSVTTSYKAIVSLGLLCSSESNVVTVSVVPKGISKAITTNVTSPTGATAACALCATFVSKTLNIGVGYSGDIQWELAVMPFSSTTAPLSSDYSAIIGANSQSYLITNASIGKNYYRVKFTNGGCQSTAVYSSAFLIYYKDCTITKTIDITKNSDISLFDIVAFPNPYIENFNLNISSSSGEIISIMVFDITGKLIEQLEVKPDSNEIEKLKIGNDYQSGIYYIFVRQDTDLKTIKVIKN